METKRKKINILSEPTTGYHGRNLYFIHPSEVCGALIEVEEHEKNDNFHFQKFNKIN